jgi:murein L,D-transpeptidase YafK
MKTTIIFILFVINFNLFANEIRVYKNERRLEILDENQKILKTYKINLGLNPSGAKEFEGDNKTPEGEYWLDYRNPNSDYSLAFHLSYPTNKQKWHARLKGKNPGSNIMLHGYPNQLSLINDWLTKFQLSGEDESKILSMMPVSDWTNGCIAVTNEEIREIDQLIKVPTKIIINP